MWPDNWQAVCVFETLGTQWRMGPGGAYGLDYGVLPEIWRRTKTKPADRDRVFEAIRVMEAAALAEINK